MPFNGWVSMFRLDLIYKTNNCYRKGTFQNQGLMSSFSYRKNEKISKVIEFAKLFFIFETAV